MYHLPNYRWCRTTLRFSWSDGVSPTTVPKRQCLAFLPVCPNGAPASHPPWALSSLLVGRNIEKNACAFGIDSERPSTTAANRPPGPSEACRSLPLTTQAKLSLAEPAEQPSRTSKPFSAYPAVHRGKASERSRWLPSNPPSQSPNAPRASEALPSVEGYRWPLKAPSTSKHSRPTALSSESPGSSSRSYEPSRLTLIYFPISFLPAHTQPQKLPFIGSEVAATGQSLSIFCLPSDPGPD
ncbi:uncharacterized protein LY79DRAFT_559289 [Colletotrichum navitas]|uniref:Uncharacterized protein n=1 Tax=Colletotrichum navitas TaxID=681940 RepID=A0AAD8PW27_9PEZI|nr:uncharacterized protein LY79DRAFT_559289 [Colletotrichum navitas]KAK1585135.1 hypothetical protein LY79DRAFT_559289 [Colletotrichum navitas]